MPRKNTTSPARITAAARRREAVALRLSGLPFEAIGSALGVSRQQAHRLVTAEIGRTAAEAQEATDALRALELERLDAMQAALWDRTMAGELEAVDRLLKIITRRCALLGLDRPAKIAPTTPDGDAPYDGGGLAALLRVARPDHPVDTCAGVRPRPLAAARFVGTFDGT